MQKRALGGAGRILDWISSVPLESAWDHGVVSQAFVKYTACFTRTRELVVPLMAIDPSAGKDLSPEHTSSALIPASKEGEG